MIDVNTMVLENVIEYTEVDTIVYNNNKYILLSNINYVKDSCIRKIVFENNIEYVSRLDDDNEFDMILNLFMKKNETLFS